MHPKGTRARVLLTSVFGPYAQDDEYGSRTLNPMELYHNQVTREEGEFSLRMAHRSWGLMLIQANIAAPCTLLDFPTRDMLLTELRDHRYDIVGISSIIPNVGKVRAMCGWIRELQPDATIVVGGHVANLPNLDGSIDADHVVRGEGVRWMRRFLGQDDAQPIRHPRVLSGLGTRTMGITLRERPGDVAATLLPSVGCPVGCNFCSTSAMFGGKGSCEHFYETGDELFEVMCDLERELKVQSFFVMDENFLLHRARALRLLDLIVEHAKPWSLYVFSSANVLRAYSIEQLVALGISWVWMGIEGEGSQYAKLSGADTKTLVRQLQAHGIRVLGSTIIGLESHTPETIDAAIDFAVSHDTEFHQFMLYTPIPGTPLHAEHRAAGTLTSPETYDLADTHGQFRFNYRHPHIPAGHETEYIKRAFRRDFEVNGPSILRVMRTALAGYKRYRDHPDARIRARYEFEARGLAMGHAAGVWAARHRYRRNKPLFKKLSNLLNDLYRTFGWKTRLATPLLGRLVLLTLARERRRLRRGWTFEPPSFRETTNQAVLEEASAARHEQAIA